MKADLPVPNMRSEDLIDLPELARTIGRYKWGILALTFLSAAITTLIAFSLQPSYRGTVSVLIELQQQRVVEIRDVYDSGTGLSEYYGTQYMILSSRDLAGKVVDRLKLVDHPEFAPKEKGGLLKGFDLRKYLPFLPEAPETEEPPTPEERRETVITLLMDDITVEPLMRTQIIKVHYESHDPQLAADVPNALADLYIESGLQAKLDATTKATQWLTQKLTDIQGDLAKSEAALQAFREQEQLVSVNGARTLIEDAMTDYSSRLREAQKRRADLQASYEKIRAAGNDPRNLRDVSTLLIDPLVQRASESYLEAREVLKQLEERYGSKHPQMATARARLATAEAALNEQMRVAAEGVKNSYELALASEQALQQQVASARGNIQRLDRKSYEMSTLQREVQTNRELYDTFLTRFKETDTTSNFDALIARVVDPAIVPQIPFGPQKKKWVMIGTAVGFLLSLLLALLHYLLGEGIRSAEELESLAQAPVFGVVPLVGGLMGRERNLPKFFLEKPRTPFSESIRSIRAAVRLTDANQAVKRLMVTSSVPKEGKSSVSGALAIAFAANDERVVLLETDLRKPSQRRLFGLGGSGVKGITEILTGNASLEDCLYRHEDSGIWILPAGHAAKNPAELLSGEGFRALLDDLDQRFDRVILDSPPSQAAADALVLSQLVQAVLFVVKSDSTTRRAVQSSLKHLRMVGTRITGIVVNQVDTRRNSSYAQGYYYAYDYYG
ncbi:MAG TPA: polysaccharide biosynthesis tyrosine autokinase [Solimonas sp.]